MGKINLNLGDCMEAMAKMEDNSYDLAIVDPPYGINFAKKHTGTGWIERETKDWDKEIPTKEYFDELFRVSKNQIIWGANYMTNNIPPSMGWIFWDKGQREFSLADGELAFTSFNKAMRVFTMSRGAKMAEDKKTGSDFHPTRKPVKLYEWLLLNYAQIKCPHKHRTTERHLCTTCRNSNVKILDTHGGSMSIALACHNLGFNLDLWELDEDYYKAGVKRYNQHIQQTRLF